MTIFRQETTSAVAGFHTGSLLVELEFGYAGLVLREVTRKTGRKPPGARRKPTTNSINIWHRAGGGGGAHCRGASALITASAIPALQNTLNPF